jgi:myo-inositol catabolism protein IolC
MDTKHETEYSQTMVRETKKNVIEVDISFYHPDDNETIKVYDEEGMREEFENKLKELI